MYMYVFKYNVRKQTRKEEVISSPKYDALVTTQKCPKIEINRLQFHSNTHFGHVNRIHVINERFERGKSPCLRSRAATVHLPQWPSYIY